MSQKILAVFCLVLFVIAGGGVTAKAFADCFSCKAGGGSDLVCEGASTFEVIKKCGSPDYSEQEDKIAGGGSEGNVNVASVKIETFYYDCGQNQFTKILKFKGGKLFSISNGDKGSGDEKCW